MDKDCEHEIVLTEYSSQPYGHCIGCNCTVILDAFHYGRDYQRQQYRERYIIHSLDKDRPFEHDVIYDGVKYPSANFCAGEFLKKTKEKAPLFYNINTEEIFEELYD
jgi:hypothetical protein